jgi:DNA-binding response OmpR family regulator
MTTGRFGHVLVVDDEPVLAGVVATYLEVDADARDARVAGSPLDLTPTEFDLLSVLSERPRLAFSRHQLIETIWGDVGTGDEHLVDVHIANLRRKLGDGPTQQRYIVTVRGTGYRMGPG